MNQQKMVDFKLMILFLKNAKIFRGKGVPLEPRVLESFLKSLDILNFQDLKEFKKDIYVNIVNQPPEIKIAFFSSKEK